jgi:hypothetical protein
VVGEQQHGEKQAGYLIYQISASMARRSYIRATVHCVQEENAEEEGGREVRRIGLPWMKPRRLVGHGRIYGLNEISPVSQHAVPMLR